MPDVIEELKTAHRNSTPPAPLDLSDPIRRGQRRRRRRRIASAGVGAGVTAGLVVAALVLPGASSDSPEPAEEPTFAILDEPQHEIDKLPPTVRQHSQNVDLSSTRLVGEFGEFNYWLATNKQAKTCVITAEDGAWLGTACGGGNWVASSYGATGDGPPVTSLVFPENMELGITQHAGFTVTSDNLAISTARESERASLAGVLKGAAEYYSVFAEPQQPADRLPELRHGQQNVWFMDTAARYLGEYRGEQYWVGARRNGNSELVYVSLVRVGASDEWLGTANLSEERGMLDEPWGFINETADIQMWLVPDGYELSDEEASTWERVAPNLYHDTGAP